MLGGRFVLGGSPIDTVSTSVVSASVWGVT